MPNKFTFNAIDKKAEIGLILKVLFISIICAMLIFYLWVLYFRLPYNLGFIFCLIALPIFFITTNMMKKLKKLRTIVFDEKKIIVDDEFGQNIFDLSQTCKVSVKAWFRENNKNSYIILILKSGKNKIRLTTSTQVNLNFCTEDDIAQFKLLIDQIDNYAMKHNVKKVDLKKSYHYSFARNYYYQF